MSEGTTMSSDVEGELTRRKFKVPKKGICHSIPVHPTSVPRKLRSAISKRSRKSASATFLDSKRLKHSLNGVASLRKYGPRDAISMPISKEEEEVAETLFALAGMVSPNDELSEIKRKGLGRNNDTVPTSLSEDCPKTDSVQEKKHLIEAASLSWPKLSERRQLNQDLKVSVPPVSYPPLLRTCDERQLPNSSTTSQIATDSIRHRGVDETRIDKVLLPLWQSQHFVTNPGREQDASLERIDSLQRFGLDGLPSKSSSVLFPSWVMATASSSIPDTHGDSVPRSTNRVSSSVNGTMKSRKRCITHVYISHLIQGMQKSAVKDTRPLHAYGVQPSMSSFIAPDNNDLSGAFTSQMLYSTIYKNACETGNRVPMNIEHPENKDEGSKKQSFDFLSLSTGVVPKADTGANRFGTYLKSKSQVHSVSQTSVSQPCSTFQNTLSSRAYQDQVAVGSMATHTVPPQVHMPQYFANAFNPAHMVHAGTAKPTQHRHLNSEQLRQQQQQQQQQQIWTSLAAQLRSGSLPSSHIANWQNRSQDPRFLTQPIQKPHLPPPQTSLETIGSKFIHIPQQSSPQAGPLAPVREDKGGRFPPDGVLPLQLLCNERL